MISVSLPRLYPNILIRACRSIKACFSCISQKLWTIFSCFSCKSLRERKVTQIVSAQERPQEIDADHTDPDVVNFWKQFGPPALREPTAESFILAPPAASSKNENNSKEIKPRIQKILNSPPRLIIDMIHRIRQAKPEEAESIIEKIRTETTESLLNINPSVSDSTLEKAIIDEFTQKLKLVEPKNTISRRYSSSELQSPQSLITSEFYQICPPEMVEIGRILGKNLIPSNILRFDTKQKYEIGLWTNKEDLVGTEFEIELSAPQKTKLSEKGKENLAKSIMANQDSNSQKGVFDRLKQRAKLTAASLSLGTLEISTTPKIRGILDHKSKTIRFERGNIIGSMPVGGNRTLLSATISENETINVVLGPQDSDSENPPVQWTKQTFMEIFGDFSWPKIALRDESKSPTSQFAEEEEKSALP